VGRSAKRKCFFVNRLASGYQIGIDRQDGWEAPKDSICFLGSRAGGQSAVTIMKKNILISAGGTATAWHLAFLVSEVFVTHFNLFVCDINPPYLIPTARLAQRFIQVPRIESKQRRCSRLVRD
jgi:hypothetical protein